MSGDCRGGHHVTAIVNSTAYANKATCSHRRHNGRAARAPDMSGPPPRIMNAWTQRHSPGERRNTSSATVR